MFTNLFIYYITHRYDYIHVSKYTDGKSQTELPDNRCYSDKNMSDTWKGAFSSEEDIQLSDAEAGTKSLKSSSLLITSCTDYDLAQDLL